MQSQLMGQRSDMAVAFTDSIPVMMGYIPLGIVFGFLFVQAGASPLATVVSSILIYGGAAQYMMVPMVAAGASIAAVAFATAVINLRHIFYGISLIGRLPSRGWQRWYIAFALTDETYSLLCTLPEGAHLKRMVWLAFFNHTWWITGSFLGAVLGAAAHIEWAGIDFVLTSLFAMLTCEQWRHRKTAWPLWSALAGYAAARVLFPEQALALSIAFCVAAGLVWGMTQKKATQRQVSLDAKKEQQDATL